MTETNNQGADLHVSISGSEERWSLKTQADKKIEANTIHISKFMELGKGKWLTKTDIDALRTRFLEHMDDYDRIFSLRAVKRPGVGSEDTFQYELVEIPKKLLLLSADQPIEVKARSRQRPKPASIRVTDGDSILYELYFDGGTERKLQVKRLDKSRCIVHATWKFRDPSTNLP